MQVNLILFFIGIVQALPFTPFDIELLQQGIAIHDFGWLDVEVASNKCPNGMRELFVLIGLSTAGADGGELLDELIDVGDVDGIMLGNADHLGWGQVIIGVNDPHQVIGLFGHQHFPPFQVQMLGTRSTYSHLVVMAILHLPIGFH